jgi:hypothetical protein
MSASNGLMVPAENVNEVEELANGSRRRFSWPIGQDPAPGVRTSFQYPANILSIEQIYHRECARTVPHRSLGRSEATSVLWKYVVGCACCGGISADVQAGNPRYIGGTPIDRRGEAPVSGGRPSPTGPPTGSSAAWSVACWRSPSSGRRRSARGTRGERVARKHRLKRNTRDVHRRM